MPDAEFQHQMHKNQVSRVEISNRMQVKVDFEEQFWLDHLLAMQTGYLTVSFYSSKKENKQVSGAIVPTFWGRI